MAGWRAVFAVLAAFGVVLWVLVWRFLPETHPVERRTAGCVGVTLRGYAGLLPDRRFMAFAVLPGLAMSAIMADVAGAPFVLQLGYGLTEHQFALIFALNGAGGIAASQVNATLVRRRAPLRILRVALPATLALIAGLLAVAVTGAGGIVGILGALWLVMAAVMFVPANANANATASPLTLHGERAGSAAALIGALQTGTAGLVSTLVGLLGGDAVAMAVTMLGALLVAFAVLALGTPANRREPRAVVATPSLDAARC